MRHSRGFHFTYRPIERKPSRLCKKADSQAASNESASDFPKTVQHPSKMFQTKRNCLENMQVVLPDGETRATFEIRAERPMDDEEFFEFCAKNPALRIERNANGEIIIMPPAGAETGFRNSDLTAQLAMWSKRDGRGRAFDSNAEYILANGAALSPDASWVQSTRLEPFTKEQKKRLLQVCPDFVVELISPTDRLPKAQAASRNWGAGI